MNLFNVGTMNRKEEYQDERWKARAAEIRELDHHQCVMCGAKDVELHVHHLSYPPPPFHIWEAYDTELVTLCKDCHAKIHQSTKRPKFNESRELFDIETTERHGDCSKCMHCVQPYLLDDTDKWLFDYDGLCVNFGGVGCRPKETITCELCMYRSHCRVTNDNLACDKYRLRTCDGCIYSNPWSDDEGFHSLCGISGLECCDCDELECHDFYSRFKNEQELKDFYKQFD